MFISVIDLSWFIFQLFYSMVVWKSSHILLKIRSERGISLLAQSSSAFIHAMDNLIRSRANYVQ